MDHSDVSQDVIMADKKSEPTPNKELEKTEEEEEEKDDDREEEEELYFPVGRVKRIIKSDLEITKISADSVLLITKATDQFLSLLANTAYKRAKRSSRKGVQYKDLYSVIKDASTPSTSFMSSDDEDLFPFMFLSDLFSENASGTVLESPQKKKE